MRLGLLLGLAIIVGLVAWQGATSIVERLEEAGWAVLLVALFIPPDLALRSASYHLLFLPGRRPRFADSVFAMWIGSSVNFLLPVATLGGEFVKARMLTLRGVRGVDAAASILLDKTVQSGSVLLWTVIGTAVLIMVAPADEPLVIAAVVGAALLALGIAGFVYVQYAGAIGSVARPVARLSNSTKWQALVRNAGELDAVVRALYRRPGTILLSTLLRLAKRGLMGLEVWFIAWLLGYPIGLTEAVMLNSLAVALRSAAFVVPSGLGVQEGGYIMLGALIGLPPDLMLTISLATRLGEVIEGLPGLFAWQVAEGRSYWGRRKARPDSALQTPPTDPAD